MVYIVIYIVFIVLYPVTSQVTASADRSSSSEKTLSEKRISGQQKTSCNSCFAQTSGKYVGLVILWLSSCIIKRIRSLSSRIGFSLARCLQVFSSSSGGLAVNIHTLADSRLTRSECVGMCVTFHVSAGVLESVDACV